MKLIMVKPKEGRQSSPVQPEEEGVSKEHTSAYRTVMLHLDLTMSLAADLKVWMCEWSFILSVIRDSDYGYLSTLKHLFLSCRP